MPTSNREPCTRCGFATLYRLTVAGVEVPRCADCCERELGGVWELSHALGFSTTGDGSVRILPETGKAGST